MCSSLDLCVVALCSSMCISNADTHGDDTGNDEDEYGDHDDQDGR